LTRCDANGPRLLPISGSLNSPRIQDKPTTDERRVDVLIGYRQIWTKPTTTVFAEQTADDDLMHHHALRSVPRSEVLRNQQSSGSVQLLPLSRSVNAVHVFAAKARTGPLGFLWSRTATASSVLTSTQFPPL
jgi:hypothetical protein